jgi:hypothetical protein
MHQPSKKGKWRGRLLYLLILLVWRSGGTRDLKTSFFGMRDLGQRKGLTINIGRRWDDRDGILKRDGFEGALHACACGVRVAVDMWRLDHASERIPSRIILSAC